MKPLIIAIGILTSLGVLHAEDTYLKIQNPEIKGSVTSGTPSINDTIKVVSFGFFGYTPVTITPGTTPNTIGTPQLSPISCIVQYDPVSFPDIFKSMVNGTRHETVTLIQTIRIGELSEHIEIMKIELKNAYISSFSQSGANGDQSIGSFEFTPEAVRITTTPIGTNGQPGQPKIVEWNFKSGTKGF